MTVTSSGRAAEVSAYVDPQQWPDIAVVPHSPVRAAIAERLFRHAVRRLPLRIVEPDAWYGAGTGRDPVMRIVRRDAFFSASATRAPSVSVRPTWPATGSPRTSPACSPPSPPACR